MNNKTLLDTIIDLKNEEKLTTNSIDELKEKYDSSNVDVVCACVTNNIEKLNECIKKGDNLSICNGAVLRYTVEERYVQLSCILLNHGIEP